mgnify:CR=1 FL=1
MLPLEENIANTAKVVETAHILGADVEAELGHVGIAAKQSDQLMKTFTPELILPPNFVIEPVLILLQ